MDAVTAHRIHFAFTATYHYLFPQLTMGLALIIVILKSAALRTADAHYDRAAGFWGRILAINFAMGVVTGIPLEFQLAPTGPDSRAVPAASSGRRSHGRRLRLLPRIDLPGPLPCMC